MGTAVMTRRAFDTWANVADQLCRCLETGYSDVLEHHTVPATEKARPEGKSSGLVSFPGEPSPDLSVYAWLVRSCLRPFVVHASFSTGIESSLLVVLRRTVC